MWAAAARSAAAEAGRRAGQRSRGVPEGGKWGGSQTNYGATTGLQETPSPPV